MNMYKQQHHCELKTESDSCLPQIPPQTGKIGRWHRSFKKLFIVSPRHYQSLITFRSRASIVTERKRHLRVSYWFVIHPCSKMSIFLEILLTILWLSSCVLEPAYQAFYGTYDRRDTFTYYIIYILDMLQMMSIFVFFIYGYRVPETSEMVLIPKRIALHYVKTFCLVDFFGCYSPIYDRKHTNLFCMAMELSRHIRLLRLITIIKFSRNITYYLKFTDSGHDLFVLVLIGALFMHWSACILYLVARVNYKISGTWSSNSWIVLANITDGDVSWKYLHSLHASSMHFFMSGFSIVRMAAECDVIVCFFITVTGFFFHTFAVAFVLHRTTSNAGPIVKYEELLFSLNVYFNQKKLPSSLKSKLIVYYEHKFHKQYFKESALLASLSEHLRYEILLHSCQYLVHNVELFSGLSKIVLGKLIACIRSEIFLTNDVIFNRENSGEYVYLVVYGSLAMYTSDGFEMYHITDGHICGILEILLESLHDKLYVLAAEISEVFVISRADFLRIYDHHQEFQERIRNYVTKTYNTIDNLISTNKYARTRADIITDLKQGKILEKREKR